MYSKYSLSKKKKKVMFIFISPDILQNFTRNNFIIYVSSINHFILSTVIVQAMRKTNVFTWFYERTFLTYKRFIVARNRKDTN